jgi:acyl-CoA thioesterase I
VTRARFLISAALIVLGSLAACAQKEPAADQSPAARVDPQPLQEPAPAPSSNLPRIVMLGDSLTAGLGLPPSQAYPAVIQQRLNDEGLKFEVVNAGVSGDTSAGALRRLDWALDGDVRFLVVALGGNDGLRGLPVSELRQNLSTIIERAQVRRITVVLAGMEAPPNFGKDYTIEFRHVYSDVARKYGVKLLPFLLDRVAGNESLNQRDGIHPTAEGANLVADNVWAVLRPLLEERSPRT